MSDSKPLYITTPIYYVNAAPHLGTLYSTVVADAFARFHRAQQGSDSTFFLTGLDEHGAKIERMAAEKDLEPKAYCDTIASAFESTWARMGISHDRFIRTTDADHAEAVNQMWDRMKARGDIYQADYEGLYCVGCEGWKTEEEVIEEGGQKLCPIHKTPLERIAEKNYFFRLSAYAEKLLALYDSDSFFISPNSRKNEVAEFVRGGLRDISVSRTAVKWGLGVPGDPEHVIYVWIDALTNYLTALGGPSAVESDPKAQALWAQSHHIIAKDILRFHAVYWPAMLMSAGLPPPKGIFCHGFLTVKGQKISKSIPATRVDPNAIEAVLGPDPLRYFLLREYTFGADGDFSYEALLGRYGADLGNDLGNLLNRTVSMAHKYIGADVPAFQGAAPVVDGAAAEAHVADSTAHWAAFTPSRALEATFRLVRGANAYIDHSAPWKLAKLDDKAGVLEVICNCLELIRVAARLIAPAMPHASAEILRQLGRESDKDSWPDAFWTGWPGGTLKKPVPVFPRLDADQQAAHIEAWMGPVQPPASAARAETSSKARDAQTETPPQISIDDFAKVQLCAARVVACEPVPKAKKLLKLDLDIGTETRTVVSGIAEAYQPHELVGKSVIFVANLKPAKIRGVLSQGMILAAGDKQIAALSGFDTAVPAGTPVR